MRDSLEKLTHELGLEQQVRFAGFVADCKLPQWYGAADLFVLTSIVDYNTRGMEGFGMAFTEAQAAGLPVIGTRSGGIPDAVREGEGGWLIAERDVSELADHFHNFALKPEIFIKQGQLARQRILREMSWKLYAQRLLELV